MWSWCISGGAVQGVDQGRRRPADAHHRGHARVRRRGGQQQLVSATAAASVALSPANDHKLSIIQYPHQSCLVLTCLSSWQPVINYIDSKCEDFLNAESRVNRRSMPDNRVHCCLYFIAPSGHGYVCVARKMWLNAFDVFVSFQTNKFLHLRHMFVARMTSGSELWLFQLHYRRLKSALLGVWQVLRLSQTSHITIFGFLVCSRLRFSKLSCKKKLK